MKSCTGTLSISFVGNQNITSRIEPQGPDSEKIVYFPAGIRKRSWTNHVGISDSFDLVAVVLFYTCVKASVKIVQHVQNLKID